MSSLLAVTQKKQSLCRWGDCNKKFPTKNMAFKHVKEAHIETEMTNCHWKGCKVKTVNKANLVNHLHKHIPRIRDFCYVCERPFKWTGDYRKHIKTHTDAQNKFNEAAGMLMENLVNEIY